MNSSAEPQQAQDPSPHLPPSIERLGTLAEMTQGAWVGIADVRLLAGS